MEEPMIMRLRNVVALGVALACAATLASCGGGGSSPTAPQGFIAIAATVLLNEQAVPTIQEARLVLDGTVVAVASSSTPVFSAILLDQGSGIASGHHTLSVLIAAQTTSPNSYQVLAPDVSIFNAAGVRVHDIKLDNRSARLATGQSIDYGFDF
jgi:hypothetical protein